jgi:nucleoside-diphosphate-sugar epimerase
VSFEGVTTLVLGASGFIGRHVAAALIERGAHSVISGRDPHALAGMPAMERIPCDVISANEVTDLIDRVQPAVTFNLAGYGVDPAERDPAIAHRVNTELPAQLAQRLATLPRARLVHVGSAQEYGAVSGDLREDTLCAPTTLYGQTKLAGSIAIREQSERTGLQALTARLFTVYGPGELAGRLLPALIRTAHTQTPLQLTDGMQQRDFTYVGDVVDGLLRLAKAKAHPGEVINLATGQLETVRRFAERAARVIGLDHELLRFGPLPTRAEEMAHDPVAVRRLRELTDWLPATSIEEGVRKTIGQ